MNVAIVKYNAGNILFRSQRTETVGDYAGTEPTTQSGCRKPTACFFRDKEKPAVRWLTCVRGIGPPDTRPEATRFGHLHRPATDVRPFRRKRYGLLSIFDAEVLKFRPEKHEDKVPHMGWNTLARTSSPLFKGFGTDEFVYFVHSYYVPVNPVHHSRDRLCRAVQCCLA